MGLLDVLFGSENKTTEVAPARIESRSTQTPEQQEALKKLLASLGGGEIADTTLSPGVEASLAALEQMSLNAAAPGGTAANTDSVNKLQQLINQGSGDIDEYFTTNVEQPLLEAFQTEILPAISRRFGQGNNFFSSDRATADQNAEEDILDKLVSERARIAFEERSARVQESLQAIGLLPGAQAGASAAVSAPVTAAQGIQAGADAKRQQEINNILNALGLQTTENIAFAPVYNQSGGSEGIIGDLLGTSMQAAKLFMGGK